MRRGVVCERTDVNFSATSVAFNELYGKSLYPLVPIKDISIDLQYGTSSLASTEPVGLPILRMNNLQDDEWDLRDLKYIDLPQSEAETYQLKEGDLLFNRTNSKELVGKCGVFNQKGHWVFASYLIRVALDESKALPDFVSAFLGTKAGRVQIGRVSRQIAGMSNINAEEIRQLVIPLPPVSLQADLVTELQLARQKRSDLLQQSDAELVGINDYISQVLGVTMPPVKQDIVYATTVV